MALNRALGGEDGVVTRITIAVPSGTASGDPVKVGGLSGIALTDRDPNGNASVAIKPSQAFRVSVLASTDYGGSPLGGASAVALGDTIYKASADETLSKTTSGGVFGYALGTLDANGAYTGTAVASGETGSCDVLLA